MRTRYKEVKCFESDAMHILHERKEKNKGFDTTQFNLILLYRVRCAIICACSVCVCLGLNVSAFRFKRKQTEEEKNNCSLHMDIKECAHFKLREPVM